MLITKRKKEDHDDTNYKTLPKGIQESLKEWKGAHMSLDGKIQNYSGISSLQSNQYDSELKGCYCSVAKSCLTLCNLLQSLLCPPLSPGVCSNSCPLSWWRYLTILSSATPFAFGLQSFSASGFFFSELALRITWPKYGSFSFSNTPSKEYLGLISFKIDWFDLLAVQGILKSLLQHHSLKASILQHSAFFMVQLSHLFPHV